MTIKYMGYHQANRNYRCFRRKKTGIKNRNIGRQLKNPQMLERFGQAEMGEPKQSWLEKVTLQDIIV